MSAHKVFWGKNAKAIILLTCLLQVGWITEIHLKELNLSLSLVFISSFFGCYIKDKDKNNVKNVTNISCLKITPFLLGVGFFVNSMKKYQDLTSCGSFR